MKNQDTKRILSTLVGLSLVSALGIPSLAGCSDVEEQEEEQILAELSERTELVSLDSDEVEPRIFEPGEHLFFKRIDVLEKYFWAEDVQGGQVEIPTGYIPLAIENWEEKAGDGSQTRGVDIWYINTVTVKAQPIYNKYTKCYEYTEPGNVISLEEEPKVLQKTQE